MAELVNHLRELVHTLKPYESDWCPEIFAQVTRIPNGFLIGSWDAEKDAIIGYAFVPIEGMIREDR